MLPNELKDLVDAFVELGGFLPPVKGGGGDLDLLANLRVAEFALGEQLSCELFACVPLPFFFWAHGFFLGFLFCLCTLTTTSRHLFQRGPSIESWVLRGREFGA